MNAIERIQQEYLCQQGIECTADNVRDYGLDTTCLHVIYEDTDCWVVLYKDDSPGFRQRVVNIVYKDDERRMVGVEI